MQHASAALLDATRVYCGGGAHARNTLVCRSVRPETQHIGTPPLHTCDVPANESARQLWALCPLMGRLQLQSLQLCKGTHLRSR